jgi:hypothetical protein
MHIDLSYCINAFFFLKHDTILKYDPIPPVASFMMVVELQRIY